MAELRSSTDQNPAPVSDTESNSLFIEDEMEDFIIEDWKPQPDLVLDLERLPLVELGKEEGLKDECVISAVCKEVVKLEEMVRKLPCRHYHHHECIAPWLDDQRTCPYCRYEIRADDLKSEPRKSSV